jgi:peptidoglycan/LPS O-acetylase OafA/YrhL
VRQTRGWVIYTPALYLAIALGAAALGWRRRNEPAGQVALALAGSGLLLVLPLVVVAPGTELRYSGWLFTSSVAALAACFARPAVPPRT